MYPYYYRLTAEQPTVIAFAQGDVNGDGIMDNVYLTGKKPNDSGSPFTTDITLVIQDGRTQGFFSIPLESNAGYEPSLFLGDFTGNGVDDIQININSGGSGGYYFVYIYSFLNNQAHELFNYETFNDQYLYDVVYRDHYKVDVTNQTLKLDYIIDISNKGEEYLSEIYTKDGILKSLVQGWVSGLNTAYPVDFNGDGVYELFVFQRIAGRYNADGLGLVQSPLYWNGEDFIIQDQWQYVAVPGMEQQ
ncbi:VCBS repeat-containing protein [Halobacillus sp. A5]|uniref:VCBS repeat-containing protein n=1 Tax=Halobacillus sp. A5 TaxID=2880263 RepID=UPI0020A6C62C|nr:VCBS repeat-containing protein [Halobacillus sp. A5]MCP3029221.1 VCBS repeat-containing protein [Halobacillus sp. A5]